MSICWPYGGRTSQGHVTSQEIWIVEPVTRWRVDKSKLRLSFKVHVSSKDFWKVQGKRRGAKPREPFAKMSAGKSEIQLTYFGLVGLIIFMWMDLVQVLMDSVCFVALRHLIVVNLIVSIHTSMSAPQSRLDYWQVEIVGRYCSTTISTATNQTTIFLGERVLCNVWVTGLHRDGKSSIPPLTS